MCVCVCMQVVLVLSLFCRLRVAGRSITVLPCWPLRHMTCSCSVLVCSAAAMTGMLQLCLMISASHANGAGYLALVDVISISPFWLEHKKGKKAIFTSFTLSCTACPPAHPALPPHTLTGGANLGPAACVPGAGTSLPQTERPVRVAMCVYVFMFWF